MAYKLRAPHSMAQVAKAKMAPKGCRRPYLLRGSGTKSSASFKVNNFTSLLFGVKYKTILRK
jgi:hypothetical protein